MYGLLALYISVDNVYKYVPFAVKCTTFILCFLCCSIFDPKKIVAMTYIVTPVKQYCIVYLIMIIHKNWNCL